MVDSVKQYNLAGVASEVELGKKGPKIDGTSADAVALKTNAGTLSRAEVANATISTEAVTLAQLSSADRSTVRRSTTSVSYNSGTVTLLTVPAGAKIIEINVSGGPGNWLNTSATTNISVGDADDVARLLGEWEAGVQQIEDADYTYATQTDIIATVTAGGATAGTADVTVVYINGANQVV